MALKSYSLPATSQMPNKCNGSTTVIEMPPELKAILEKLPPQFKTQLEKLFVSRVKLEMSRARIARLKKAHEGLWRVETHLTQKRLAVTNAETPGNPTT